MDELNQEIERILNHLDKERWIAFTKDDSPTTFKAKDKLRAYELIERHGKLSWQLTKEGYKAIELGGYRKWLKAQDRNEFFQKITNFLSKFLWYFVIPIIVGLIVWALTVRSDSYVHNTERVNTTKPTTSYNTLNDSVSNDDNIKVYHVNTDNFYLQSYSPVEIFNGELIIVLNKIINSVNDDIELKILDKNILNTEIIGYKKVGDNVNYGNYIISLLSLERNISTYDLMIKVEKKN